MIINWIILGLSLFSIVATLASLLRFDDWWIRAFDFPRVQISILLLASIMGVAVFLIDENRWYFALLGALIVCIVYQLQKIYTYTSLAPFEVQPAATNEDEENDNHVSLMVANVLTPNREAPKLLNIVAFKQPQLLLTLETDQWWEEQLEVLEKDYPYTVKIPKDNLYGMHLFSKLPLIDPEIRYLMQEDIPSIRTQVRMPSGKVIWLYCLHPVPPSPTENYASTDRDAELLLVGKEIQDTDKTVVVAGDLNDVAWSYTTELFQDISGLIDPRKGRGFYSTFHAKYLALRWPLDHVFHSTDFKLIHLERLPAFGSDHFPIYVSLHYEPSAKTEHNKPQASAEDEKLAHEKIQNGKNGRKDTLLPDDD